MHAAPSSLDPADRTLPDSFGRRALTALIFDTLVTIDDSRTRKPALAEVWQAQGNQRWQFRLRNEVTFQDGSQLSAEIAAASLRFANPSWRVSVSREIEHRSSAMSAMRTAGGTCLAQKRDRETRSSSGNLTGTGAFQIADWQPGKKLSLAAEETAGADVHFSTALKSKWVESFRDQMSACKWEKQNCGSRAGRRRTAFRKTDTA